MRFERRSQDGATASIRSRQLDGNPAPLQMDARANCIWLSGMTVMRSVSSGHGLFSQRGHQSRRTRGRQLEKECQAHGLKLLLDVREKTQAWCFQTFRDQFNRRMLGAIRIIGAILIAAEFRTPQVPARRARSDAPYPP